MSGVPSTESRWTVTIVKRDGAAFADGETLTGTLYAVCAIVQ